MLPSHLVQLEAMPLNANGKVDRKALPAPDFSSAIAEYVAPATLLEQQVAAIWSEILGIERIGMQDHLDDLGVNSLSYMRAIVALEEELDFEFLDEDMGAGKFVTVADVVRCIEKRVTAKV
jgi:acyl carrier protein